MIDVGTRLEEWYYGLWRKGNTTERQRKRRIDRGSLTEKVKKRKRGILTEDGMRKWEKVIRERGRGKEAKELPCGFSLILSSKLASLC